MSVEVNQLSMGACLFERVTWVDCFVLLECNFLMKMVATEMLMEVVAEVVVVESADVLRAGIFVFFRCGCFGNMMNLRVVIEVGVGVIVLMW